MVRVRVYSKGFRFWDLWLGVYGLLVQGMELRVKG